jgi:hypothetical protein
MRLIQIYRLLHYHELLQYYERYFLKIATVHFIWMNPDCMNENGRFELL